MADISLTWDDNSDNEETFEVQRSLDGSNWSDLVTLTADTISHLDTSLLDDTTYYYRVRAVNAEGASAWSNTANATTPETPTDPGDPGIPGLTIPANAITVTPATIASAVSSNPAGTNFRLTSGPYRMLLPLKNGNGYYGFNVDNPAATVIDGQWTRSGIIANDCTFAHMEFRRFIGHNQLKEASSPLVARNGSEIINCWFKWNQRTGMRIEGNNVTASYVKSWENGSHGFSVAGTDCVVQDSEFWRNGVDDLPPGVERFPRSDRGACKNVFCNRVTLRRLDVHDHDDQGLWFDIANRNMVIEDNTIYRIRKMGIDVEASYGPATVRNNTLTNCSTNTITGTWWRPWYAVYGAIGVSTTENVEVYNNVITGAKRGISGYMWNHPQFDPATSPPRDEVAASCLKGLNVHDNDITASETSAGITHLSNGPCSGTAYDASWNNTFQNNIYRGAKNFQWELNRWLTESEWNARGLS